MVKEKLLSDQMYSIIIHIILRILLYSILLVPSAIDRIGKAESFGWFTGGTNDCIRLRTLLHLLINIIFAHIVKLWRARRSSIINIESYQSYEDMYKVNCTNQIVSHPRGKTVFTTANKTTKAF